MHGPALTALAQGGPASSGPNAPRPRPPTQAPVSGKGRSSSAAPVDALGPWRVGETAGTGAALGWKVTAIEQHSEFVRVEFRDASERGAGPVKLEIVARPATGDPFSTARYRVQPAPGESPDEEFVLDQVDLVRAWEQRAGEATLFAPAPTPGAAREDRSEHLARGPPNPVAGPQATGRRHISPIDVLSFWHVAWLLLPLLSLLLALATARHRPALRRSLAVSAAVTTAVPLAAAAALHAMPVPIDWITPLHEGTTEFGILRLYGEGIHSGDAHQAVVFLLGLGQDLVLPSLVRFHALLAIANATLIWALVSRVQQSRWIAAFLTLEWVANFAGRQAAFSELPSTLCHFTLLHGTIGWLVARDAAVPWLRWVGWLQVLLATVLLAGTRPELAFFGVTALASGVWQAAAPGTAGERWAAAAFGRTRELLTLRRPLTLLALIAGWMVAFNLEFRHQPAFQLLMPLPGDLYGTFLYVLGKISVPACVLFAFGVVELWRGGVATAWVLVSGLVCTRLYWIYGHHGAATWEMLRYGTYWLPLLVLIPAAGADGWRRSKVYQQLSGRARVVLAILATFALAAHSTNYPGASLSRLGGLLPVVTKRGFLRFDAQLEAQMWLRQLESTPECVIVTRIATSPLAHRDARGAESIPSAWIAFGGPLHRPVRLPVGATLDAAIDASLPADTCILVGRGIDCALSPPIGCVSRDGPPLQYANAKLDTWTHVDHAPLVPPIVMGIWPYRAAAAAPNPAAPPLPAASTPSAAAAP